MERVECSGFLDWHRSTTRDSAVHHLLPRKEEESQHSCHHSYSLSCNRMHISDSSGSTCGLPAYGTSSRRGFVSRVCVNRVSGSTDHGNNSVCANSNESIRCR